MSITVPGSPNGVGASIRYTWRGSVKIPAGCQTVGAGGVVPDGYVFCDVALAGKATWGSKVASFVITKKKPKR